MKFVNLPTLTQKVADHIEQEALVTMAMSLGSIGLASNELTGNDWLSLFWPDYTGLDNIPVEELLELHYVIIMLQTLYTVGLNNIYWCFGSVDGKASTHKHLSHNSPCPCGNGKGIVDVNWPC